MIIESFDGQREDEDITAVYRQHPWVMAKTGLVAVIIIVVGSIPLAVGFSWGVESLLLFIAIAGLYFLRRIYLWLNTIYILTTQRIFAIMQRGLFHRINNEVPLANIQNASHAKKGIWQMAFDFGEVEIQTSGSKTAMVLENVERPYQVQQRILAREETVLK
jgi:hypothetical protein